MRDLFLSFRSFFKRLADFVRYRNATRDMNARYPDATPEEVGREDVCIICREEMRPILENTDANDPPQRTNPVTERMRPKKLPCGHILHFACLRSWLERQQNCPTCRRPVIVTQRLQVHGGNGPALPGNAAGQPGGVAPPAHQPDQAGRNRARVINFGPLRIGFGAGGGNLIDDLAQRIHNGEPRPPAEMPGNAGGQQHFGFGFGFGRRPNPRNQPSAASSNTPIQAQLDQIERDLQQQISSLRVASNELNLVRMLNNELVRLRTLQATDTNNETVLPQMSNPPLAPIPAFPPGQLPAIGHQPTTTLPTILSSHQQQVLSSDSDTLPEGVNLPPGWTLLPLQRSDGANRNVINNSRAANPQPATTSGPALAQATNPPPPSHPSTGLSNPLAETHPPSGAASNTARLASPAPNPIAPRQVNSTLPSWGFAPNQANGDSADEHREVAAPATNGDSADEHREAATSATNGESRLQAAAKSSDTAEKGTEKGKGKAATVEDLVDDVD
jgi:E3 ubiquitin-protein ligase synoviolin